jgi:catechol 2,3-dioxygenase-like lactoylglutathione lyase family enzyme
LPKSIHPVRVNHINLVVEDFDASLSHLERLYGGLLLMDLPQAEWHAGLIDIGRVIFEIFAPPAFLLNARYGPHYLGIEYQADMEEVREAIAERGIRIIRDIRVALHTHPADCHGVAFEFYDGYFHDNDQFTGGPMRTAEYWRDEHRLGLTGLKAYTVAVPDLEEAGDFFRGFLGGEPTYDEARPAISARALGLAVADAVVELVAPAGEGVLQRHLQRFGEGIRSTVFGVSNIDQTRRYFRDRGVELVPGAGPGAFAIPAELNLGALFEFSE